MRYLDSSSTIADAMKLMKRVPKCAVFTLDLCKFALMQKQRRIFNYLHFRDMIRIRTNVWQLISDSQYIEILPDVSIQFLLQACFEKFCTLPENEPTRYIPNSETVGLNCCHYLFWISVLNRLFVKKCNLYKKLELLINVELF